MKWFRSSISFLSRLLLLTIFIAYSGSIMMFYHTHEVDGILITHSHPYKIPADKGTTPYHSHTTSQYLLLQHLSQPSMTDSFIKIIEVPDILPFFSHITLAAYSEPYSTEFRLSESLRAPPSC